LMLATAFRFRLREYDYLRIFSGQVVSDLKLAAFSSRNRTRGVSEVNFVVSAFSPDNYGSDSISLRP
jgi:hypothetical protein